MNNIVMVHHESVVKQTCCKCRCPTFHIFTSWILHWERVSPLLQGDFWNKALSAVFFLCWQTLVWGITFSSCSSSFTKAAVPQETMGCYFIQRFHMVQAVTTDYWWSPHLLILLILRPFIWPHHQTKISVCPIILFMTRFLYNWQWNVICYLFLFQFSTYYQMLKCFRLTLHGKYQV